jgi:hypothetical protein
VHVRVPQPIAIRRRFFEQHDPDAILLQFNDLSVNAPDENDSGADFHLINYGEDIYTTILLGPDNAAPYKIRG